MTDREKSLVDAACAVRARSHSPYSHFRVGAALLAADGKVHLGTNVENASFGLSICAERTAVVRAVTDGDTAFTASAVCTDGPEPTSPCGACRQVRMEFAPDAGVLMAGERGSDGPVLRMTVSELLPLAFVDFRPAAGPEARP